MMFSLIQSVCVTESLALNVVKAVFHSFHINGLPKLTLRYPIYIDSRPNHVVMKTAPVVCDEFMWRREISVTAPSCVTRVRSVTGGAAMTPAISRGRLRLLPLVR